MQHNTTLEKQNMHNFRQYDRMMGTVKGRDIGTLEMVAADRYAADIKDTN